MRPETNIFESEMSIKVEFQMQVTPQIVDKLRDVPGVINVVDLRFYNMESGGYSDTIHFQAVSDRLLLSTGGFRTRIEYIDNTILGTPLSMFEVKYPDRDILVRIA